MKRAGYSGAFASAEALEAGRISRRRIALRPVFRVNKRGIAAAAPVVVSRGSARWHDTGNDPRIYIWKRREPARCCDVAELIGLQPADGKKKQQTLFKR